MPHEWNNIVVATEEELVPNFFPSYDALRMAIKRHQNFSYGPKRVRKGGGGHPMLVSFDSLSKEIQTALGDPRRPGHIMELYYSTDDAAVRFYGDYQFEDGSYLSLAHQEEYITNASVLQSCRRLLAAREQERRSKSGSLKGIVTSVLNDAHGFNKILEQKHQVRHTLPASEKRFKEVFRDFAKDGAVNYGMLISGKLKNNNARVVTDEVLELLNGLFAGQNHKPTRTEISRLYDSFLAGYVQVVKDDASGELFDPKDFKKLSEATIINYLGAWEHKIGTHAKRSGDRQKLMSGFKPYHSLERPAFAGSLISIDDRQPPFEYQKGSRMWFYNGIDLGSEAFTCWVYGKSKEGIILEFYRQLVRNYTAWGFRLPAELEAEASLNSSYVNTFLRPGALFSSVRIEANNARGKRIERYFGSLRYQFEKDREGWLARPFARSESNQIGGHKVPIIPYNQIVEGCLQDIETWNNMPHAVHTNKTRWEVFEEMQHPDLQATNWKAILPSLGCKTETSCRVGIVKLQGREFLLGDHGEVCTGEDLINLMKRVEGRNVDAYWLDDNEGKVLKAVLFVGDTCICEAIPKPTYSRATIERTPAHEAARETMSKYVATVEGYQRRKAAAIEDVIVIDNRDATLNRKFQIPGISRALPAEPEEDGLLHLPEEEDYVPMPAQGFIPRQIDRF